MVISFKIISSIDSTSGYYSSFSKINTLALGCRSVHRQGQPQPLDAILQGAQGELITPSHSQKMAHLVEEQCVTLETQ